MCLAGGGRGPRSVVNALRPAVATAASANPARSMIYFCSITVLDLLPTATQLCRIVRRGVAHLDG